MSEKEDSSPSPTETTEQEIGENNSGQEIPNTDQNHGPSETTIPPENQSKSNPDVENKSQISQQESNNNFKIIAGSVTAFIFILILYFLFRGKSRIYDLPIPYIPNSNFYNYLRLFVDQPTHKEVLVIHGATGVGKTRGINIFADELLNEDDRLVFNFDFKLLSKYSTLNDFITYITSVLIKSLQNFDGHQAKYGDFKSVAQILEAYATVDGPLLSVKQYFKDPIYQRIIVSLLTITERNRESPINTMKTFLLSLDALSLFKPVLIIHDINGLADSECEQVRLFKEAFWQVASLYADDSQRLPIIVEVSNDVTLIDGSIPLNNDKLRLYRVNEFSQAEAKKTLVSGKIFPKKVFQLVSEKVGYNGQIYATIYDLMKEGIEPQIAYNRLFEHAKNLLEMAIKTDVRPGTLNPKLKFIKQLTTSNNHILPLSNDFDAAQNLLKWKVISLVNTTHCTFSNRLVSQAANSIN